MRTDADDDAACYGDGCADFYDEIYPPPSRTALSCLKRLAGDGPLLEAGVGTGRYALPLAAHGIPVHGIDASAAMLAVLRRKPGAAAIGITLGDFSRVAAPGRFSLVVCLVDTLSLLPDARRQAQAVARFAAALLPHGHLLLETTFSMSDEATTRNVDIALSTRSGLRMYRVRRSALDAQLLDDWAADAGLERIARWRDWRGEDWNGECSPALSLYRRKDR
ncbi:class I SAM-dependent methyltransferase [Tahibacter sp.]|uniref:class I SAM-dependent methyltransferase n=1 Tax=Tahibacter sp. TaxID=2056211 RepID=UPI0028C45482|nr:class I SAM-dependent methyltransferase [Tahibacter sp.]